MSDEARGRRWGMYLLVLAILFVGALFFAHLIWSAGAGKSLNRQVAAIKASGEPIEFSDYIVGEPLSDEENGAIDLRDAMKASDQSTEVWKKYWQQTLDMPLVEREVVILRDLVKENAKAFERIDAAMSRKGVDWRIAITKPSISVLLPHLNGMRQLANLVSARGKLAFHEGDHAAALRDIQRLRFLAEAAEQPPTLLVTHLVGIGIGGMAMDNLQLMAPTLKIGDEPGAASKQQVAEMIAALLDETKPRANLVRAFQYERSFQLDSVRCLADGTLNITMLSSAYGRSNTPSPGATALNFAAKPIALEDGGIMLRYDTALLEALRKSHDWPTFKAVQPGLPPQMNNARHLVLRMLLPSLERAVETDFRSAGERRAAAVALATRWYAAEHDGKMPARMEDLIPKYLPAAPMDPYAKAQPMKYIGPATTRPVVYSIGENGTDDGGSEQSRFNRAYRSKWESMDIVTHLTPQPRQTPPAEDQLEDGLVDDQAASIYPEETMEAARRFAASQPSTDPSTAPAPATQP